MNEHLSAARAELFDVIRRVPDLLGELDTLESAPSFTDFAYATDLLDELERSVAHARDQLEAFGSPDSAVVSEGSDAVSGDGCEAPATEKEVDSAQVRRELEEAKVALGWAWLRGGASLAEGIRRKTAFLEGLIPVCEETDRAQVEALALVRESGELREAAIGQRDAERNRRLEAERERDEARRELSAMREAAGMFRRCQHPDCRGGTRILDNGMRFRCDTCAGRGLVEVSNG